MIALTEEIARLKDLKGRPKLKPSGLEKGTDPGAPGAPGARPPRRKRRGRHKTPPKSARLIVDEDRIIPLTPGPGWRFKGYKRYTVQDLVIEVRVVRYWRACYQTPDGQTVIAPLPAEVSGHFGPNLVRYLLSQHYQCRVKVLIPQSDRVANQGHVRGHPQAMGIGVVVVIADAVEHPLEIISLHGIDQGRAGIDQGRIGYLAVGVDRIGNRVENVKRFSQDGALNLGQRLPLAFHLPIGQGGHGPAQLDPAVRLDDEGVGAQPGGILGGIRGKAAIGYQKWRVTVERDGLDQPDEFPAVVGLHRFVDDDEIERARGPCSAAELLVTHHGG